MSNTQIVKSNVAPMITQDILEKVLLHNDLSPLNPREKVMYVRHLAVSYGLDPDTNPIKILKNKKTGAQVPYAGKEATEQLRKNNKVSIEKIETQLHEGGLYTVIAYASLPDGRKDSSTGVLCIQGLKGENLSNAMMKTETKAKRRVTLSICGLGILDESEVDSIKGAVKVDVVNEPIAEIENNKNDLEWMESDLEKLRSCKTHDELKRMFTELSKYWQQKKNMDAIKLIILAKDERKGELDVIEYNNEIEESEKNNE